MYLIVGLFSYLYLKNANIVFFLFLLHCGQSTWIIWKDQQNADLGSSWTIKILLVISWLTDLKNGKLSYIIPFLVPKEH